eukprot:CAMPEP_0195151078 /NCGR_PEP_ID=MMETSP0448-20130528/179932_1 /TAXON_ID=66468 /ORGANISM="Heterocapsa triquestra, Strain CCMP 448" /LENGTH=50 /DNA_ID=CAMNT_0040189785 /DNA_START=30 /DNA_END=178 /DNA_ORIENTATION=-
MGGSDAGSSNIDRALDRRSIAGALPTMASRSGASGEDALSWTRGSDNTSV